MTSWVQVEKKYEATERRRGAHKNAAHLLRALRSIMPQLLHTLSHLLFSPPEPSERPAALPRPHHSLLRGAAPAAGAGTAGGAGAAQQALPRAAPCPPQPAAGGRTSREAALRVGGRSRPGLTSKKAKGISRKPIISTGLQAQQQGWRGVGGGGGGGEPLSAAVGRRGPTPGDRPYRPQLIRPHGALPSLLSDTSPGCLGHSSAKTQAGREH